MKNSTLFKSLILSFSLFFAFNSFLLAQEPVAVLNELTGGYISTDDFKKQTGLDIRAEDAEMGCKIESYNMVWVEKGKDPVEVIMRSADFNEKALNLIQKAKPGTVYYFDSVKTKCSTSDEPQKINSLVFRIQ